jgi:YebC/PmpR family DNA-binding regulatory protein
MAGHSKWKNIRLHKGKADAERGKVFAKLSRELTIAARQGGGSPDSNPRLRLAIEKAKASSMPADNIKRAVQKGTGELASENYEELTYEGYGPAGVAVLVEAATDNKNRTVADLRHLFSKHGGNLGENGSVAWQFARKGMISLSGDLDEDAIVDTVLEVGAEDVEFDENDGAKSAHITTAPEDLARVRDELTALGHNVESAELTMVPSTTVALEGDVARRMLKLMDALEDHDDVQNVSANFDIGDEELD